MTTASFAADTQRYFVATRRPVRELSTNSVVRELGDSAARRIETFSIVNGFTADLTASEAASLRRSSGVRYVERVVPRQLHALSKPGEQVVPYGIAMVHAPEAWEGRIAGDVNVAVIDSGVDYSHAELQSAWKGGTNFRVPEEPSMDKLGHGTHVAGTVAAANNHLGVVGVAPQVRLWGIKAFGDDGKGSMEDVVKGLNWVLDKKKAEGGRWIVNISAGGPEGSTAEEEAFARAISEGVIVVASTGNESKITLPAPVSFPAAYPDVVSVGAVDEDSEYANFSNLGPEVDFVAPGVRVVSLSVHGDEYLSYVRTPQNQIIETRHLDGSKAGGLTAEYINCGLGTPADFGPAVKGKIALIQRGGDTFADKARRAKEAGAAAVLIYNNADSSIRWTLFPAEDPDAKNYPWPIVVAMTLTDGEALVAKGHGVITIAHDPDDYEVRSGTSMSSPHVTGAIAHLWSLAPDATPQQILNALISTAKDIGTAGKDDQTGYGLIDVNAAAHLLAPSAFGRTGRRFLKRR
jgi:subtilisin family serine protease